MDSKPFIRSSNIWGRMVLSFLGPKVVLFYEIIGWAFNAPPRQLTYIFDPAGNRVKLRSVTLSIEVATGMYALTTK